ncbi:hypothetical protein F5146DRAFT_999079 [Armillaria mellea]|nr:hypothetical protein F5146DRAFT_999079 [Armillaria mellea]
MILHLHSQRAGHVHKLVMHASGIFYGEMVPGLALLISGRAGRIQNLMSFLPLDPPSPSRLPLGHSYASPCDESIIGKTALHLKHVTLKFGYPLWENFNFDSGCGEYITAVRTQLDSQGVVVDDERRFGLRCKPCFVLQVHESASNIAEIAMDSNFKITHDLERVTRHEVPEPWFMKKSKLLSSFAQKTYYRQSQILKSGCRMRVGPMLQKWARVYGGPFPLEDRMCQSSYMKFLALEPEQLYRRASNPNVLYQKGLKQFGVYGELERAQGSAENMKSLPVI